ncbi:MAG TPA: hypothetical protein VGE08_08270 [Steroidobacter sp.]|uniref:hypothetical protein n=1 Tax=Steroidobacter sp. TaxID=1978227 RepID=UPI002EDA74F7
MRDAREFDDDFGRPRHSRSVFGAVESVLLLGALAVIASPAIKGIARRYRVRNPAAADSDHVDESLKETFPASDPPASRFVDIPSNRRN